MVLVDMMTRKFNLRKGENTIFFCDPFKYSEPYFASHFLGGFFGMMTKQFFLSIQSCVSYGHVGNSAVTFPLQRLGADVYPIHTVLFSNHTGYGAWKGSIVALDTVKEVFEGLKDRGVLQNVTCLLTGYMGSVELGHVMLEALWELKNMNPHFIYCCDPVMGDVGRGFFVKPEIPPFFRNELIKHATIITPNHFELEYLSGRPLPTLADVVTASRELIEKGSQIVLTTSAVFSEEKKTPTKPRELHVVAVSRSSAYILTTPLLPTQLNGTGDLTSALFTYFYKATGQVAKALEETISRVYAIIHNTHQAASRELLLVNSQEEIVQPPAYFKAEAI
jgi:pyridoxine kinase